MGRFDDEDTGRHARLGDIMELRGELQQSDQVLDRALRAHADEDRAAFTSLQVDVKDVRKVVDKLAIDTVTQNGKLDTLIARTDGRFEVLDERTVSLQARTKSRERLEEKQRDTQQLDVTEKKKWRRTLLITLLAGLFTTAGAVIGYKAHEAASTTATAPSGGK